MKRKNIPITGAEEIFFCPFFYRINSFLKLLGNFMDNQLVMIKHVSIVLVLVTITSFVYPDEFDIPDGYYDPSEGLYGIELKTALYEIINDHDSQNNSSLWTHFQSTDMKTNSKVWDMYSDIPDGTPPYEFTFVTDQCGNYSQEGDCYNREHSWPSSWYNDNYPMKTDLFHIYPTDGYVNNRRANYPFGEVGTSTWVSENGSKVGSCSYPDCEGTIFEPIDEYKGDFARTYFYMSTRYLGEDSGWDANQMVDGAELKPLAVNLLMDWHESDPVSEKELDRNEVVYEIQGNRNPYIDHPEYADRVWRAATINVFSLENWNMVGLPLVVDDPSYQTIFPSSVGGTLYSYNGAYIPEAELIQGNGYWLRFQEAGSVQITGVETDQLHILLTEGWNMISGISSSINVSNIIDPEDLILPNSIYGFETNYYSVNSIEPGKGYWVRSDGTGEIIITVPASQE